ncbi:acyl-CoA dehydrogenase family protein (plasmid) [Peteryoungia desertarenae]|uniref:Acyl-CoA dehydrogenase family protein n=1 Tax=Peteryoungia desertarenae TaxID=1813451 RepID=A0ABX6QUT8_9HYPH|nr:acyl-CoA dehydrogenase family protein [Peteryoungia desertarenae]QLF72040.1 acyl-CoA dehydrogenase family protein [Peteryoungia desertarenae]
MDFSLTDEQLAIRDMAESFARDEIAPHALDWDENKHFPVDVIRKAAGLGLGGIMVAENYGGSALGRLDAVLVYEALAKGCAAFSAYLSIHNMVATMIDKHGSARQKETYLPSLCSGQILASYCLTEPACGSDAAALTTRAERDGDDYLLTGQKMFISGAGATDLYVVMARSGGPGPRGISAFLVEQGATGLGFGANEKKMGWNAQPTRTVMLDRVRVRSDAMLGPEGAGFKLAMEALDGGRTSIAACSLGGAQSAFDRAIAYTAERKAFGQKLNDFQALQFVIAEMATDIEVARTFLWRAASALDGGSAEATRLCAMAKKHVTDSGFDVANRALQLHGGYGYLANYGVEKIVRDLRVHQILEGTNEIMRLIIARSVLAET